MYEFNLACRNFTNVPFFLNERYAPTTNNIVWDPHRDGGTLYFDGTSWPNFTANVVIENVNYKAAVGDVLRIVVLKGEVVFSMPDGGVLRAKAWNSDTTPVVFECVAGVGQGSTFLDGKWRIVQSRSSTGTHGKLRESLMNMNYQPRNLSVAGADLYVGSSFAYIRQVAALSSNGTLCFTFSQVNGSNEALRGFVARGSDGDTQLGLRLDTNIPRISRYIRIVGSNILLFGDKGATSDAGPHTYVASAPLADYNAPFVSRLSSADGLVGRVKDVDTYGNIVLFTDGYKVMYSSNGGLNWAMVYDSSQATRVAIVQSPKDSAVYLFFATDTGVYRARAGTTEWTKVLTTPTPVRSLCRGSSRALVDVDAPPSTVFVSTDNGSYTSYDSGATFVLKSSIAVTEARHFYGAVVGLIRSAVGTHSDLVWFDTMSLSPYDITYGTQFGLGTLWVEDDSQLDLAYTQSMLNMTLSRSSTTLIRYSNVSAGSSHTLDAYYGFFVSPRGY